MSIFLCIILTFSHRALSSKFDVSLSWNSVTRVKQTIIFFSITRLRFLVAYRFNFQFWMIQAFNQFGARLFFVFIPLCQKKQSERQRNDGNKNQHLNVDQNGENHGGIYSCHFASSLNHIKIGSNAYLFPLFKKSKQNITAPLSKGVAKQTV